MKFYIGASIGCRQADARMLRSSILDGVNGSVCTARWLDLKPEENGYLIEDRESAFRHLAEWAKKDLDDLVTSDIFILLTGDKGSRGGKWTEFGFALACGIRCYVLGPREGAFCYLDGVRQYDTTEDLIHDLLNSGM